MLGLRNSCSAGRKACARSSESLEARRQESLETDTERTYVQTDAPRHDKARLEGLQPA